MRRYYHIDQHYSHVFLGGYVYIDTKLLYIFSSTLILMIDMDVCNIFEVDSTELGLF